MLLQGLPRILADILPAAIINAGDGAHQHPTQALQDLFTMREKKGTIEGLKVSIIGDIAHSRVARSNIAALNKMGADVTIYGPLTMIPPAIEKMGLTVASSMEEALTGVDVIMMLRIQMERQSRFLFPSVREYASFFGLNPDRLSAKRRKMC